MTEKKRIIELVKQNVITMEEALQLLEAASNQTTNTSEYAEEYRQAQEAIEQEMNATHQTIDEEKDNLKQLDELEKQLEKKTEALVIAKQRLRELEIFAELDDLTPEMEEQKATLLNKQGQLTAEIKSLKAEVASISDALREDAKEQIKKIVKDTTDSVQKAARNFSKEMSKEGQSFSKNFSNYWKDFAANFDMKDINISVPWVKSTSLTHQFVYDVSNLSTIDLSVINGSVEMVLHESDQIIIEADITLYGKESKATIERFEECATIDSTEEQLVFHINPFVAADLVVKVPQKQIDKLKVSSINGNVKLSELEVNELKIETKNGDTKLKQVKANYFEYEGFNGDVKIKDCTIADVVYQGMTGDLRYKGSVGNLTVEMMTGDILLTKEDATDAKLNLHTVSGDVKVAVPQAVNLIIDTSTSTGDVKERLTAADVQQKGKHIERFLHDQAPEVKVEVKTTTGDIYFKD